MSRCRRGRLAAFVRPRNPRLPDLSRNSVPSHDFPSSYPGWPTSPHIPLSSLRSTLQYPGHGTARFSFSTSSISASVVCMFHLSGKPGLLNARCFRHFTGISVHSSASPTLGLTLGSTRTPPTLSSALSRLFAISSLLSASAQAVPVSPIR